MCSTFYSFTFYSGYRVLKFAISILLSLALFQPAIAFDRLQVGELSLPWPDGWKLLQTDQDIRLKGPNKERMIVTYLPLTEDPKQNVIALHKFAKSTLPDTAKTVGGKVIRPLEAKKLPTGLMLYSTLTVSEYQKAQPFFLQYLIVGDQGGTLLTLQGKDSNNEMIKVYDKAISQATWASSHPG